MVVNGKEISQWVDLVNFDNNSPYLRTDLVDALLTQEGAMYDGQYGDLIAGEPGNQYINVDLLNDWIERSQKRYQQRVNLAKNAYYEFSSRLSKMDVQADDKYPYEKRVIAITKKPVLYRCEDGGISTMVLMKTIFTHEQAKYICGWSETYTVQTKEVTGPKSGDFFDLGSSRVVNSKTEIEHHGGIREDDNYYYLKVKSDEQRDLVLSKFGPEYGVYLDPLSRVHEGHKADGSFVEKSIIYTLENGAIMPVKQVYHLSITPERIQKLLSNRGVSKLQEYSRAAKVGMLELIVAAVMMFPFTCLFVVVDLADILYENASWIAKYLLGILPGIFNGEFWPPTNMFTYGSELLLDTSTDGLWLVSFWLAVPVSIAFGASFLLWRDTPTGISDVFAKIFLQIILIPLLLLVYPLGFPIYMSLTCYMVSHQIILKAMAKYDIKKRKIQIERLASSNKGNTSGGTL